MASKKKKTSKKRSDFATLAEYRKWKKRSDASKAGWRGRTKEGIRERLTNAESVPIRGLGKPKVKYTNTKGMTLEQLEHRLAVVEATLAMEVHTRGWVHSQEAEDLHKDMTIALMPSRLRHLGPLTDAMERMLKKAFKKGKRALRKQAREYAEFFDVPLREVYTLFFSP
jgi:hypothetical protein